MALFVTGLSAGLLIPEGKLFGSSDTAATVYLDVNPSIELKLDKKDRVVECIAGNDDAITVLSELKLEGIDMNTALAAIVGSMYVNGYIGDSSNSILVSVDADDNKTDRLLADITDKINSVFKGSGLECSIIAQSVSADDSLRQKAEENKVSVGKMYLLEKITESVDEHSELADMSIGDLSLIYNTKEDKDTDERFDKDIMSGFVNGYIGQSDALEKILSLTGKAREDIDDYDISAKPRYGGGERKMVYSVSISFKNDPVEYEYEIDCLSGEVTLTDTDEDDGGTKPERDNESDEKDRPSRGDAHENGEPHQVHD